MNINRLICPNCGADLIPNNSNNIVNCSYCNSNYVFDYGTGALTKITNSFGASNVEASNVTINNYYTAPNDFQNRSQPYGQPYGQPVNQQMNYSANNLSNKNRTVVSVLCFLVGCLGIHYFYVNRIGMGILYLFTGGLFGIGWLVDVIRTLSGVFPDENGRPITVW